MATAAKCGALELCRLTAWDRELGVTVQGAGKAGGCGRGAHLPQSTEMAGESHPSIRHPAAAGLQSKRQKSTGAPGCSCGVFLESGVFGRSEVWGASGGSRCRDCMPTCPPFSQQKGIPCHLCQVAVSVMGKILQDNRTEVGLSREGEWGCCSSLPTPPRL